MPHIINTKGPTHVLEKGAILTCYEQKEIGGIKRVKAYYISGYPSV